MSFFPNARYYLRALRFIPVLVIGLSLIQGQPTMSPKRRTFCHSDTTSNLTIPLPLGEAVFANQPGMKEALERREESFRRLADRLFQQLKPKLLASRRLSKEQRGQVSLINVAVDNARNGLGRADLELNAIVIDEAYFRVGLARAYSDTLFRSTGASELYETWTDYMVDSIQQQDPTVYLDGMSCYLQFRPNQHGEEIDFQVRKHMTAWFGFVVFHELAHLLLRHDEVITTRFPSVLELDKDKWPAGAFELSRSNELAADKLALEIMNEIGPIDLSDALPGLTTWLVARHETLKKSPDFYPTHPDPRYRVLAILDTISLLQGKKPSEVAQIKRVTGRFIDELRRKMSHGALRPVPMMRGERPATLTASLERFIMRDAQLTISTESKYHVKCLSTLIKTQ